MPAIAPITCAALDCLGSAANCGAFGSFGIGGNGVTPRDLPTRRPRDAIALRRPPIVHVEVVSNQSHVFKVSHVACHDWQAIPQRDRGDQNVRHTDDTSSSFEVCVDSAGEARSCVVERQDLGYLEGGFELRHSVFASDAPKPVHDFGDRYRRGRKATLLR
jgi:hypothetical protein